MIKLTDYAHTGGCAGKVGPGLLSQIVQRLPGQKNAGLLVGLEHSDDAGVYQLDEATALVQTVDFFGPMVDDPYTFGQIAAANSLSDIYAMGGRPLTALNIVAYPMCKLGPDVLTEILHGGQNKISEAGALIAGGHTVENAEPKYGLSVTGIVHPAKVWTNAGARPGDRLILTKAIGTGVLTTAAKAGLFSDGVQAAIDGMTTLNRAAAEAAGAFTIHACTDITGFGLLGHLFEVAAASGVRLELSAGQLPFLPEAAEAAAMGLIPAAMYANREHFSSVTFGQDIPENIRDLCYDPQTSGGLLFSVPEPEALQLVNTLKNTGISAAAVIGKVTAGNPAIAVFS